jgi:hypothetical protein
VAAAGWELEAAGAVSTGWTLSEKPAGSSATPSGARRGSIGDGAARRASRRRGLSGVLISVMRSSVVSVTARHRFVNQLRYHIYSGYPRNRWITLLKTWGEQTRITVWLGICDV